MLGLPAGDYVLTVDVSGDLTAPYQFRLSDLAQAAPLTPGTPVSGDLTPASETDFYRFVAAAGDPFFFDARSRSGAPSSVWRLVDPFGNFVPGFPGNSFADVDTLALPLTGTYTLLVEGGLFDTGTGTYTFNVQPVSTPQPLALGTLVNAAIGVSGEQDRYTFTLAADARLYFDALTSNSSLTWTLAGPTGVVVNARAFTSSDGFRVTNPVLAVPAGDYVLTVDAGGDLTAPTSSGCRTWRRRRR